MTGDLLGFDGPSSSNDNGSSSQAGNASNKLLNDLDNVDENKEADSIDHFSESAASAQNLTEQTNRSGGNNSSGLDVSTTKEELPDFAMIPADTYSQQQNEEGNQEQHDSESLLDFGGEGDDVPSAITSIIDEESLAQDSDLLHQSSQQQQDLFEMSNCNGNENMNRDQPMTHRDSFAPVVEEKLVNLLATSTDGVPPQNGTINDTGDPFVKSQQPASKSFADPFQDISMVTKGNSTNSVDTSTMVEAPTRTLVESERKVKSRSNVTTSTILSGAQSPIMSSDLQNDTFANKRSTMTTGTDQEIESAASTTDTDTKVTTLISNNKILAQSSPKEVLTPEETDCIDDPADSTQSSSVVNQNDQSNEKIGRNDNSSWMQDRPTNSIKDKDEKGEGEIKESTISHSSPEINSSQQLATPSKQEANQLVSPSLPATKLTPPSPVPDNSDEITLRQHIRLLEKELHAAHTLIMQLQHHEDVEESRPGDAVMVELQASLQNEMNRRAEAEDKMRLAQAQCQKVGEEYKTFKTEAELNLDRLTKKLEIVAEEKAKLKKDYENIREERDEQARKEMALTTRLNAAKKKEAIKSNEADHYEDQVDQLEKQVAQYKSNLESMTAERDQFQNELTEWKNYAEKRTKQLETALNDEKKLNDERKRKMKGFVEAKTEEVRSAKADYLSLQTELDQTSHSLKELNQRYKQLHAQWVQSQTRNRELQRDMTKMKKDSEKMLKAGGTLEARLSRSAQESEDHKNKRLQAKHELMSVLGQLEAERALNSRFQESIKMTFTPKALSQQQTMQDALHEFEAALQKLSIRLGRPLAPPPSSAKNLDLDVIGNDDGSAGGLEGPDDDDCRSGVSTNSTLSEINTNRALQKLECETRRVSQNIVAFSTSVERMHTLLEAAGTRNCVDALSQILMNSSSRQSEETRAINDNSNFNARRGQRYDHISGTMS